MFEKKETPLVTDKQRLANERAKLDLNREKADQRSEQQYLHEMLISLKQTEEYAMKINKNAGFARTYALLILVVLLIGFFIIYSYLGDIAAASGL